MSQGIKESFKREEILEICLEACIEELSRRRWLEGWLGGVIMEEGVVFQAERSQSTKA